MALAGMVLMALLFWLIRRGKLFATNAILMIYSLAIATILATIGRGIHDVALIVFPIVFIFAGFTFSRKVLTLCVALSILSLGWLVVVKPNEG